MEEQPPMAAHESLTSAQQALADLWDQHLRAEFVEHNAEEAVDTMVEDATVNHVPVLTGGVGRQQLHEFYSNTFIPQIPPDQQITPISRTIGTDRLVDEFVVAVGRSDDDTLARVKAIGDPKIRIIETVWID